MLVLVSPELIFTELSLVPSLSCVGTYYLILPVFLQGYLESGNRKLKEISVVCEIAQTRAFLYRLRSLQLQQLGLKMHYHLVQRWLCHRLSC